MNQILLYSRFTIANISKTLTFSLNIVYKGKLC